VPDRNIRRARDFAAANDPESLGGLVGNTGHRSDAASASYLTALLNRFRKARVNDR